MYKIYICLITVWLMFAGFPLQGQGFIPNAAAEMGTEVFFSEINPVIDDMDGDGILDEVDNCPSNHNPEQSDSDGDGEGDACDSRLDIKNPLAVTSFIRK